jgi:hypothetical protein
MNDARRASQPSIAWYLLLLLPSALFAIFLVPGLGDYGEGLWPEWFAFEQKGTPGFGELATTINIWSIGTLVLAIIIASLLYAWTVRAWRSRLSTFDVNEVKDYRRFVWWRLFIAFVTCCSIAALALVISESLREAALASWVIFVVSVGLFGSMQLMVLVLGLRTTLLRYWGR